ncbi:MAG: ribonucleoside triphosphate reductase, partial [Desulfotomaculales bacterium]
NKKPVYVLRLIKHPDTYVNKIDQVPYKGIIWCPHTANETVIARRNGTVFVTGNTPFTNVTLDLVVPEFMKSEPAVINGRPLGDFQEQVDMFNRAFCEVMLEGDARQRGFGFPIPTYNITDRPIDQETYRWVFKLAGRYGSPYFANFISSDLKPEDVRSMCCRLRIQNTELKKRGGGLFGANPLTGAVGVCTINLSRLGYLAKDEEDYFARLARLASIAVTALEIKRKVLERLTEMGLYPYTRFYLRSIKERFGRYWANHFSTVGVVAGNEACLNLLGKGIDSREGRELMIKTLHFLREFIARAQERTGNLYNLEATPAEGASYRLALIDKKKYPDIKVANEEAWKKGAAPYYSNSTQLPVNYTDDVWEVLEHQEALQELYTGGTVIHIFTGEEHPDPDGLAALVHRVFGKFRVPYISITPTYSICPEHGYLSGEHFTCPKCGKESEVYSRIVGYYRPVKAWSDGKQAEYRDRKVFQL